MLKKEGENIHFSIRSSDYWLFKNLERRNFNGGLDRSSLSMRSSQRKNDKIKIRNFQLEICFKVFETINLDEFFLNSIFFSLVKFRKLSQGLTLKWLENSINFLVLPVKNQQNQTKRFGMWFGYQKKKIHNKIIFFSPSTVRIVCERKKNDRETIERV